MNQTQQTLWLVNNILFCYEGKKHTKNKSKRKQHFLKDEEKHSNSKEAYTDRSKSTRRKVGYSAVFADTTRREELPEESSIHTVEMTAIKEIKERVDIKWIIYTDSSSMLAIENSRKSPNTKSDI